MRTDASTPNRCHIASLWRYPVKSMLGEEVYTAEVTERGVVGGRAFALLDVETGKVASAKHPLKWGRLFDCRAESVRGADSGSARVRITLPDGSQLETGQEDADRLLSEAFGRTVRLETAAPEAPSFEEYWPDIDGLAHRETVTEEDLALGAPAGTFFDYAPIHLVTTATLAQLAQVQPESRFDLRRFRPNMMVAAGDGEAGFVENDWLGRVLAIGDEVRLRVTDPCPRCVMTTLAQGDLPRDPGVLRAAAQHNRVGVPALEAELPSVGVYATVLQGGCVRRGDAVRLDDGAGR
jgi:uncharacterized protein